MLRADGKCEFSFQITTIRILHKFTPFFLNLIVILLRIIWCLFSPNGIGPDYVDYSMQMQEYSAIISIWCKLLTVLSKDRIKNTLLFLVTPHNIPIYDIHISQITPNNLIATRDKAMHTRINVYLHAVLSSIEIAAA